MSDNPYQPPESDIGDAKPLAKRPIAGILAGYFIDFTATIVSLIVLGTVYSSALVAKGGNEEELLEKLQTIDYSEPYWILARLSGLACSFLGGYCCIKVSRGTTLAHPFILAVLMTITGLLMGGESTLLEDVVLNGLAFAAIILGGHRALQK